MMQEHITWVSPSGGTSVFYPFADGAPAAYTPGNQSEANALLYTGIPEALYQLPPLLQFPWTKYYVQAFNLTALGNSTRSSSPSYSPSTPPGTSTSPRQLDCRRLPPVRARGPLPRPGARERG